LKAAAPDRNIELRINALPDVFADASLLRQVFVNLPLNAIKLTGFISDAVIEVDRRKQAAECIYSVRWIRRGRRGELIHHVSPIAECQGA
jgi:light-regulated signal transduction histidine kinase (bacteriophytochrome)